MKALISGQAAVAVLIDGDEISSFCWDDPEILVPRRPADLRLLFGTATDVVELPDTSHPEAVEALGKSWSRDRAVHMALILLDRDAEDETRLGAAECLDEFLADPNVADFATDLLTTAPLPYVNEVFRVFNPDQSRNLIRVGLWLLRLHNFQGDIRLVRLAWDALPPDLFLTNVDAPDPSSARRLFESTAARAGVFLKLARAVMGVESTETVLASCLADPNLARLPGAATTLRRWRDSLRERIASRPRRQAGWRTTVAGMSGEGVIVGGPGG